MPTRHPLHPDEAFAQYLAMGADRSIRGLRQRLVDAGSDAPCLNTLLDWSRQFDWQKKVAEHDEQVAAAVRRRIEEEDVARRVRAVAALLDTAAVLMERAGILAQAEGDLDKVWKCGEQALNLAGSITGGLQPVLRKEHQIRENNENIHDELEAEMMQMVYDMNRKAGRTS